MRKYCGYQKNIDKEYFEKRKLEFNLNKEKPDNLGMYNDLSVDVDVFKNFNKRFKTESLIEDSIKYYDEVGMKDYLHNILEDEHNLIYKRYADKKCEEQQFINAYQSITIDNKKEKRQKQNQLIMLLYHLLRKYRIYQN